MEIERTHAAGSGFAERVAIDLSDDLISVKMAIAVDEDVPMLGGKTLKFYLGIFVCATKGSDPMSLSKGSLWGGFLCRMPGWDT